MQRCSALRTHMQRKGGDAIEPVETKNTESQDERILSQAVKHAQGVF